MNLYIKEVADKIFRFEPVFPACEYLLNMYFITEPEGVLIEPGPTAIVPHIQEAMKYLGMKDLAYIIPTHIHVDNGAGAGKLAQLFPGAKVVAHPQGARHMVDPTRLIEGTKSVWGDTFESYLGPVLPIAESRLIVAKDGEVLTVSGRELQIIHAPGHASHQIAIFDCKVKGVFCGEALGELTVHRLPTVVLPSFDLELCVGTIEKIRNLKPRLLFYSHGDVWKDPEQLLLTTAEGARMYGSMILDALKQGKDNNEIVEVLDTYIVRTFGVKVRDRKLHTAVEGYTDYFKKKGMV